MPAFSGVDFLEFDSLLNDEELLARKTARQFVEEHVIPIIEKHNREATFPMDLVPRLGELGFFGSNLEGYGCAGMSNVAYGLVMQELERGDSGLRSFVSVQSALVMYPIHEYGSEAQKERWLPRMQSGKALGCFGLTEPQFGSNPGGMLTRAVKRGDRYILNGEKLWITNGSIADLAIVWAQTDDGIRGFIVPRGTRGFHANDIHRKLSLRASVTSELVLSDCRLPGEALLPLGEGLGGPLACLNEARYGIVWGAMGAARACYETALEYSKTRVQFDRPIGGYQITQQKLVDMLLELDKGALLALHLGRLKDEGRLHPAQVSFAKLNNVREALRIAREARTILGANGVTLEYPVIRHMNNLESVLTYEGTSEMHALIVGKEITGLAAFT